MKLTGLILSIALASCSAQLESWIRGAHRPDQRILNGHNATVGEAPYIVGLSFVGAFGAWFCGGTIIGNCWILTAVHCTYDSESVTIYYGATQLKPDEISIVVSSDNIIEYDNMYDEFVDLALIRTPFVEFNDRIQSVQLANSEKDFGCSSAKMCGWGSISNGSQSDVLQCADLHLMRHDVCSALLFVDDFICVDTDDAKTITNGDFGGPLINNADGTLIGIAFSSLYINNTQITSLFVRVSAHRDWILSMTGMDTDQVTAKDS